MPTPGRDFLKTTNHKGQYDILYQKFYTSMDEFSNIRDLFYLEKNRDRFSEDLVAIFRGLQILILIFKIGLF